MRFISSLAIALSVTSLVVYGQNVELSTLKFQVVDQSGAYIPTAIIQVRSETGAREFRVDRMGETTLVLDSAKYDLRGEAPGFKTRSSSLDAGTKTNQKIRVVLPVGEMCGPCITIEPELMEFEHFSPEEVIEPIPLQPLPLPARKLRFSSFHRRST